MPNSPRPDIIEAKGAETPQISRWEHLAKLAVHDYLQSCLTGDRRTFFEKFAPYSTNWKLRDNVTWSDENPFDRTLQIKRYFEDTKQDPPQILIRTTGYEIQNLNLGSFSYGVNTNGTQKVAIINTTQVGVEMACAALDPDGLSLLVHFLEMAFGPTCRFLINYTLVPSDESRRNWCVTLPLKWSVGQTTDAPLGDDRKQRLWTTTVSGTVDVEVGNWATYTQKFESFFLDSATTVIDFPTEVKVGSVTPIRVSGYMPGGVKWRVSDYRLAIITENESLFAKRVGSVTLSLISVHDLTTDPVATATVTIVP
jgi:hypothetical protein